MTKPYTPNSIPVRERAMLIIFSVLLFAFGTYGVLVNDVYIPIRRSMRIHLHDVPAWIMYAAMLCACFVMLSVVADHYDRRNNEISYRTFAKFGGYAGFGLFVLSLTVAFSR